MTDAPTNANERRYQPSPNAERLRIAMGWDKLPEMTPEQRAAFRAEMEQVEEEARRFYAARRA